MGEVDKAEGDKEPVGKTIKGRKFDVNLEIAEVMPFLEEKHQDFLDMLYTIFPPAKKRMSQFIEKAVTKFDLRIETAKEVDKLIAEKEKREKEERDQKRKEEREAREREAHELKRKLEWELNRSETEIKKRKMNAPKVVPLADEGRLLKEQKLVISELKKVKGVGSQNMKFGKVRKQRLLRRKGEIQEKLRNILDQKNAALLEKRTTSLLEKISPKQLRKLCMHYFGSLAGEKLGSWREAMESVKLEVDYSLLGNFLGLLYDHAKTYHLTKKGFKFGHMLVTSNQSELIFEKGLRGLLQNRMSKKQAWKIPDNWEMKEPSKDLGGAWTQDQDSCLLVGTFKCGKNLAKIVTEYPEMKELMVDEQGVVKEAVKQRYAYILNVYQNRGVYNEEFGDSLYSGDQEVGDEVEIVKQDSEEDEEEEVMDITKDEENEMSNEHANGASEAANGASEETNGKAENKDELAKDVEEEILNDEEVDDALLDTPDSEPGEEDM